MFCSPSHPGLQVRLQGDWRGSEQSLEAFCRLEELCGLGEGEGEEECQHQHEVTVVVGARTHQGDLLQLGAVLRSSLTWIPIDPFLVEVRYHGVRVKDVLVLKPGSIGVLVSGQCVLCCPPLETVVPALVWFGGGSYAPCVRGRQGVVVGEGEVWLEEEERMAWCQGTGEVGEQVLVWGGGGRQEEDETVRGVVIRVVGGEVSQGSRASNVFLSDEKEGHLDEQEDKWAEFYFNSLIWRLEREEGSLLDEEILKNIWQKLFEETGEEEREPDIVDELGHVLPVLPEKKETVSLPASVDEKDEDVSNQDEEDDRTGDSLMDSGFGDSLPGLGTNLN